MNVAAGRDAVFTFSYETYADAVSRGMMRPPDRILQSLLTSPEVDGLLVANPFRSWPSVISRRLRGSDPALPAGGRRLLLTPTRLGRSDPLSVPRIVRAYRRYDDELRRAAKRLGLEAPAVITTNPLVAAFSPLAWASTVTYFGRDDWLSYTGRREYWPAYREAYRQIGDAEVGVAAVSEQIIDRIAPRGPHVVVPNGVEPAEWAGPVPPAPDWLAGIPSPRAIYVGTIDERLDTEGIEALAALRPHLQIVLLGPSPEPDYVRRLRGIGNVHIHAGVGRAELVAALRNCDVSLLAHRRTPLTEAMSPLKVYEYIAAGLPVVAIDLPPIHGIDPRVLIAPTTSDMAPVVDAALELGRADERARGEFVEQNSWAARHRLVMDLMLRPALLRRGEEFAPAV